jgi:hypothetical protein
MVRHLPSVMLVLVAGLLLLSASVSHAQSTPTNESYRHALPVSAPDIYPEQVDHEGYVNVQIVAQAPDADVFFTLDGSDPTRDGRTSQKYTTGFVIYTLGYTTVKAVAIPSLDSRDHRVASAIRVQTFNVHATPMAHPVPHPADGHYKGSVHIELDYATPLLPSETDIVELQYIQKDAMARGAAFIRPEDSWVKYSAKYGIRIEHVGLHYLFIRSHAKNGSSSPFPRYLYYIDPPVVFDISTECAACPDHESPIAGEWFTVTVQNANHGSRVFLSYRESCEMRNRLDNTNVKPISRHKTSNRFRTSSAASEVYVCVAEDEHEYRAIPRRRTLDKYFRVGKPLGAVNNGGSNIVPLPVPKDDETIPPDSPNSGKNKREEGVGMLSMIGLWLLVLVAVVVVVKLARGGKHHSKPSDKGRTSERELAEREKITVSVPADGDE